jgi:hypothetical protein
MKMIKIIFILILHILISLVYFLWWYRRNKAESIYRLVVVLFIPLIGLAYLIISDLLAKIYSFSGNDLGTLHGIEKNVVGTGYLMMDFQKEINVIPLEEALLLNSGTVKRKLIVDTLKEDIDRYIVFLNKALDDQDTETSHYAAATVMEIKRRLVVALQGLAVRYENNREDIETSKAYADILKRYLQSGFLDNKSYLKYKYIYSNVLKNILEIYTLEEQYFIDKINCDMDFNDHASANEYCHMFHKCFTDSETPYIMHMKLFYKLNDYNKFNKVLASLKKSDIKFSNSALNVVRFWSEVSR